MRGGFQQRLKGNILTHFRIEMKLDTHFREYLSAQGHYRLLQLEFRYAKG